MESRQCVKNHMFFQLCRWEAPTLIWQAANGVGAEAALWRRDLATDLGGGEGRDADGVAYPKAYSSNRHGLMMVSYRGSNRSCVAQKREATWVHDELPVQSSKRKWQSGVRSAHQKAWQRGRGSTATHAQPWHLEGPKLRQWKREPSWGAAGLGCDLARLHCDSVGTIHGHAQLHMAVRYNEDLYGGGYQHYEMDEGSPGQWIQVAVNNKDNMCGGRQSDDMTHVRMTRRVRIYCLNNGATPIGDRSL